MDRKEFLEGLRSYLVTEIPETEVREHINYYERYITEEVIKGRREEDVVQELGDPWIIAKTISDMKENASEYQQDSSYEQSYTYDDRKGQGRVKTIEINTWWKRIVTILCIVGVLFFVFSLITGIIGLLAPIIFPVMVVVLIYRMFSRRA